MEEKNKIKNMARDLVLPILQRVNFDLVDIEYLREGNNWYLRVYIDKPGGITIDDCQLVSEELSNKLDIADPIKHKYILEVSSPGIERPLKSERDFERYKGEIIRIKLFHAMNDKKNYEGELLGVMDGDVALRLENGAIISFEINEIALAKRTIKL